ncbi:hypothetical protein JOD57_001209 [Geodermatophilus bullaregiensis]|uniref:hypothetical protein n=1 Tax=Geodermatophilus bullaregiensis TaxID=1564160 RepID=UPI001957249F|nr:hypothetical protein [Geodermatophilus bullaregiensis]MBM7805372.1 hypothetical protein [Geodermatophilus bullaregiensis]
MSAAVNSRAAVAFRSPQDVEVLVDGAWVPGAMLGWRHDETGGCQAQVRWRDGADGETTWVDLAAVRLPERHLSLASAEAPAAPPAAHTGGQGSAARPDATVVMTAVTPARRAFRAARRHGADGTAEQSAVGPAGAGRHRAPADAGRHRALTAETPAIALGAPAHTPAAAADAAGEPDLLTRPIRLDDLASHPRPGRPAVRPSV